MKANEIRFLHQLLVRVVGYLEEHDDDPLRVDLDEYDDHGVYPYTFPAKKDEHAAAVRLLLDAVTGAIEDDASGRTPDGAPRSDPPADGASGSATATNG